ncbi:MAG: aldo/keto reductase [Alphaproteobacteria bacterium]
MEYRKFGNSDLEISAMGLGCFGMSGAYGPADDTESVATIHRAMELGVNFFDTSASYGQGHNHRIVGEAIRGRRDQVVIHSKSGTIRKAEGGSQAEGSGTPDRLREICEISLKNLGIDCLDVFCLSRVDPTVAIEETVGGMARLIEQGKTRYISLSEASAETVRRGYAVHPLVSLQYEYSLWSRDPEQGHIEACRELGMGFMAYAPLGYGFLAASFRSHGDVPENDHRLRLPRFQEDNFEHNVALVKTVEDIAGDKGATTAQIAIAWVLAQGADITPIPGSKSRVHLEDNLGALEITLGSDDLARLEAVFSPGAAAGARYDAAGMQRVNR